MVLGFGAKKTPAYVTHILTTKQHCCCCPKLPMCSNEEEDLLRPKPSGGYSSTLLWNVHRQQGNTTVVGDAQIICSYGPRANKYEHFPIYRCETAKKTRRLKKRLSRDVLDRTGKPRDCKQISQPMKRYFCLSGG